MGLLKLLSLWQADRGAAVLVWHSPLYLHPDTRAAASHLGVLKTVMTSSHWPTKLNYIIINLLVLGKACGYYHMLYNRTDSICMYGVWMFPLCGWFLGGSKKPKCPYLAQWVQSDPVTDHKSECAGSRRLVIWQILLLDQLKGLYSQLFRKSQKKKEPSFWMRISNVFCILEYNYC